MSGELGTSNAAQWNTLLGGGRSDAFPTPWTWRQRAAWKRYCSIECARRLSDRANRGTDRVGSWGDGPFDNDDAADWVYELEAAHDFDAVRAVLRSVAGSAAYLESPGGSVGIAAAEVVAAARTPPPSTLPAAVVAWIAAHAAEVSDSDVTLALAAVDRVVGTDSELCELWEDARDGGWGRGVQQLRRRLTT